MTGTPSAEAAPRKPEQPTVVAGLLWMVAACIAWATTSALVKLAAAQAVHGVEVAFFRSAFGLLIMLPWLASTGRAGLRTDRFGLHALRTVCMMMAMMGLYYSFTIMPIAQATALNFTTPLFATLGAMVILRERVGWRRWTALAVGFAGVLVILRPGAQSLGFGSTLVLVSSFLSACGLVVLKPLSRTESVGTIVTYMMFLAVPITLAPTLFFWSVPNWTATGIMAVAAVTATINQVTITRAFKAADVSLVLSIDFLRLVFVTGFGIVLFAEDPDLWVAAGGAIIVAASVYIARREARRPGRA